MDGMPMLDPLTWARAVTTWRFHLPVMLLVGAAVLAYLTGVWATHRDRATEAWPWWRTVAFLGGAAVVVVGIEGAPGVYGEVLFWVHMLRHLMLIMIAPWLFALGYPVELLRRATRGRAHRVVERTLRSAPVSVLTHPFTALAFYTFVIVVVHLTDFMQAMMEHPALGYLENGVYLLSGYLLFSLALTHESTRWRLPYPARMGLLFMAMTVDTIVGIVLLQSPKTWPAYEEMSPSWGPGAVADLHGGAAMMWIGGDGIMFVMILVVALQLFIDRTPGTSRITGQWIEGIRRNTLASTDDRAGDKVILSTTDVDTDDEALAAYNAMLARLGGEEDRKQPEGS